MVFPKGWDIEVLKTDLSCGPIVELMMTEHWSAHKEMMRKIRGKPRPKVKNNKGLNSIERR